MTRLAPGIDDEDLPADAVEVGRVLGAWGIQGGIRVKPFAANPQALFSSKRWYLQAPASTGGPRPILRAQRGGKSGAVPGIPRLLRVLNAREQGDAVVATAQELPDRNAAEALQGARIFISRASFPTPDEDEFYWIDLIGLAVHNRAGLRLGQVVGLLETGPHCVLRIQVVASAAAGAEVQAGVEPAAASAHQEILIPFVAAYVDQVDLPGKRLLVDWQADWEADAQAGAQAHPQADS